MESYKLKVNKVLHQTGKAVSVHFEKPEKGSYKAGQFLTLIFNINGVSERRAYSLCSSPEVDNDWAVGVKRVEAGKVSNFINDNVKVGDEIEVLEPIGNFVLDEKSDSRKVVFISGGSGITPILSMLKTVLSKEKNAKVFLIYVNSSIDNIMFKSELDDLERNHDNFKIHHHLSSENIQQVTKKKKKLFGLIKKSETIESGRITSESMAKEVKNWGAADAEFYMCGPNGLMQTAEESFKLLKLKAHQVHKESFTQDIDTSSSPAKTNEGVTAIVTLKLNGEEHEVEVKNGKSILFSALDKGIDVPFSCQSGLCTACMGKCTEGSVAMDHEDGITEEEKEKGNVLTCVGHPTTEKVTIEFE